MNDAAAPLREEVRSHKVVGTLRGRKTGKNDTLWVNDASQANRQDKAPTSGSGDGPTLTRLDNGKIRLAYSVEPLSSCTISFGHFRVYRPTEVAHEEKSYHE